MIFTVKILLLLFACGIIAYIWAEGTSISIKIYKVFGFSYKIQPVCFLYNWHKAYENIDYSSEDFICIDEMVEKYHQKLKFLVPIECLVLLFLFII